MQLVVVNHDQRSAYQQMNIQTQTTNLILKHRPRIMRDVDGHAFQLISLLGQGGQGRVYHIRYIDAPAQTKSGDYVYKKANSKRKTQSIINERNTLVHVQHIPNIARYISHTSDGFIRPYYKTIAQTEIFEYGLAILACIKNLHDSGWVHCDIKYDNFCLDDKNNVIVVDLGSAQRIRTFEVHTLETALFSIEKRQQLVQLFAARPQLSPTIIDFYGFAWMMYRAIGGYADPDWTGALPTKDEIRAWKPPGIDASLHPFLQDLFLEATIEQHAPPSQPNQERKWCFFRIGA